MSAIRLARAATGRDPVLKFAGAYHGHVDGLLADAGLGTRDAGHPGVPRRDRGPGERHRGRALERPRRRGGRPRRAAARPRSSPSRTPPTWAWCRPTTASCPSCARRRTAAARCLIFDEVISGFRVGRGGAQEREGVMPDLTVLGKVIGGGLPAAAYAGPRELMERIAPAGDVYQAGTLSGNPLAVAAGLATLRLLDADAYARLERTTERLATGLAAAAADGRRRRPGAEHVPGLFTVFFCGSPVRSYADAKACDAERYGAFCRALLDRGIYPPAVAVRGLVPVARPRRRPHRPHDRSRPRGLRRHERRWPRWRRSVDPALAPYVVADPPPDRFERRARVRASRPSTRATSSTTASRAPSPAWTTTSGCWPGDALYALGLQRLAAAEDVEAVAELGDLISLCARAEAEGRRELVRAALARQRAAPLRYG